MGYNKEYGVYDDVNKVRLERGMPVKVSLETATAIMAVDADGHERVFRYGQFTLYDWHTAVIPSETVDYAGLLQAAKDEYLARTDKIIESYFKKNPRILYKYLVKAGDAWQAAKRKIKMQQLIEKLNC